MKRWIVAVCLAALPLSLSAQSIANGSFTNGLSGWTPSAPAKIAVTGGGVLRMSFDSQTTALFATQELTGIEAGAQYTLGAKMRLGAASAATLVGSLRVQYLDASGASITALSEAVDTSIPGTNWLYFSTTGQAPANTAKLRVWLRVEKKPSDTTPAPWQTLIDFDEVALTRQVPATHRPQNAPARLSPNGTFLHGGQPIFPIGIYSLPILGNDTIGTRPQLFAALRAHGFNAVRSSKVSTVNDALLELKAAHEAGLWMNLALNIPEVQPDGTGGIRYSVIDTLPRSPWAPALLAWVTSDEPENHGDLKEAGLELAYREYRRVDGHQRPVLITFSRVQTYWSEFTDAADAFVALDYPRPFGYITDPHDTIVSLRQKRTTSWQHTGSLLQLGWSPYSGAWGESPSYEQARAMAYEALIGGAQSIWWYALHTGPDINEQLTYTWYATQSPLWPSIKIINEEIQRLAVPLLFGTRHPIGVSGVAPGNTTFRMVAGGIALPQTNRFYVMATNVTPLDATLDVDHTNRCLGTSNNVSVSATATFTIPAKVMGLAESADYVDWSYDDFTNTTTVTAAFGPLESRTLVFDVEP